MARDQDARGLNVREVFVLSWAGTRGVVSLAAIFTVPLVTETGAPFPERDLLLFCTLVVVLVTLIGQGLTFAPLARALGIRAKPADESRLRKMAGIAAIRAAAERMDALKQKSDNTIDRQAIDTVRKQLTSRLKSRQQQLDVLDVTDTDDIPAFPSDEARRWHAVRQRTPLPRPGPRSRGRHADFQQAMRSSERMNQGRRWRCAHRPRVSVVVCSSRPVRPDR
jgi:CPA1 family monovalent cation:H+ antiporter